MSLFKRAVQDTVAAQSHSVSHTVRGVIPKGTGSDGKSSINYGTWTCTVRIPHAKGAVHPTGNAALPDYLEYHDVPMPKSVDGVIQAVFGLVLKSDRPVLVGFTGGSLSFPYIVGFDTFAHSLTDKQLEKVPNRNPRTPMNFSTAGKANPPLAVSTATAAPSSPLPSPAPAAPAASARATTSALGTTAAASSTVQAVLTRASGGLVSK